MFTERQLPEELLLFIGDCMLYEVTVAQLAFMLLYSFRSPWYKNIVGIAIWLANAALFTLGLVVSLSLLFGSDYMGREVVRIIGYVMIFISVNFTLATLIYIQSLPPLDRTRAELDALRKKAPK